MRRVSIVGVGSTCFCGAQEKTSIELLSEAASEAILTSNIKPADIEALFIGNTLGDFSDGQGMLQPFAADSLGMSNIPANKYDGACASGTMALCDAFMLVAAGYYDIVLAGGVERAASLGTPLATRTFAMFGDSRYEFPAGLTFPGVFALLAHRYASHYSIPLEKLKQQMACVSVQSYGYGMHNPKAHLKKKITMTDVLDSFMVATPIQLHDCCPFSDGAAAVVITSEEKAQSLTNKQVFISGIGQASAGSLLSQGDYLPRLRAREISANKAYHMAGIKPEDIDLCELHDCFSIASLIAAEGLGLFDYGKSGEAWLNGKAAIGGKVVINPSGGLKAKGHPIGATGIGQVYEIVNQLRCEVDPTRQVADAHRGLTDTLGGDGSTICNVILERGW